MENIQIFRQNGVDFLYFQIKFSYIYSGLNYRFCVPLWNPGRFLSIRATKAAAYTGYLS